LARRRARPARSLKPAAFPLNALREFPDAQWASGPTARVEHVLEDGLVLHFPQLAFPLLPGEERFLTPACADGKAKNISLRGASGALRGAAGSPQDQAALQAMVMRYREHAQALVARLFPHYQGHLTLANTSYRPLPIEGRATSWRKDDTRLHVDAFPSNPTQGVRLLRVFNNLNPHGEPRHWRVGEDFETHAKTFLPHIKPPVPGSAWLMQRLHITKARRTPYDHYMLRLHDAAKANLAWQASSPQQHIHFMPGATWVVFSDQTPHAAMGGQYMLEQTFNLPAARQLAPAKAPVQVLQRLLACELLN
jgi:hypothetical protein